MRHPRTALAIPAALLLALGVTACQGGTTADPATPTTTPSPSATPSQGVPLQEALATPTAQTVSAMDIEVGDCLTYATPGDAADAGAETSNTQTPEPSASQPDTATADASANTASAAEPGTVSSVDLIDCAAPHRYEVYAEGAIAADAFPEGDLMEQYVSDICYDAFENYVGTSYDDAYTQGRYAVTSLRPTQSTWAQGDRRVSCLLTSVDGGDLTGSARSSDG
ncbi:MULTISPECIES: septum formation family protein [Actinomyces]|uniref:Septum formation n=1 Tax=Actinomyces glycerinitolerans TaxID=1892869 RepID=A0A1M4S3I8_9ACTO|nr:MULTISPECIES: septum formation family protein [Actinomyces]RAX20802.1 hypothetical protein DRB07_12785 [Actinomyces sp. Z3]SHE26761.1 septum formation [Actinomyces glycerinitolerans]